MGIYDIESKLQEKYCLTYTELITEAEKENAAFNYSNPYQELKKKRKNIQKCTGINIDVCDTDSREEKFDKLKILNIFANTHTSLLTFLRKPRIEHTSLIETERSFEDLEKLIHRVSNHIDSEFETADINAIKEVYTDCTNLEVYLHNILVQQRGVREDALEYISERLTDLTKIVNNSKSNYKPVETNIMRSFGHFLNAYRYRCITADCNDKLKKAIEDYNHINIPQRFSAIRSIFITFDEIEKIRKYAIRSKWVITESDIHKEIKRKKNDEHDVSDTFGDKLELNILIHDIKSGLPDLDFSPSDLGFAAENFKSVLYLWQREEKGRNNAPLYNSEAVGYPIFLAIMQELIYLSCKKVKYTNDYIGEKHSRTFTSLISSTRSSPDSIGEYILIQRLHYRYNCLIGLGKEQKSLLKGQQSIYNIMEFLFSLPSCEDMLIAHHYLRNWVVNNCLMSEIMPFFSENDFYSHLEERLRKMISKEWNYHFSFKYFATDLLYKNNTIIYAVIKNVAEKIASMKFVLPIAQEATAYFQEFLSIDKELYEKHELSFTVETKGNCMLIQFKIYDEFLSGKWQTRLNDMNLINFDEENLLD